ncbi:hypothetical protein AB205_0184780, partial [Aquarana catesbeiana]
LSCCIAVIALFCRQYDIIKDNDSNNNKEKAKPSSEQSTPERQTGGLLRKSSSGPATYEIQFQLEMVCYYNLCGT